MKIDQLANNTSSQPKLIWSNEKSKWLCYDDQIIDFVLGSDAYSVPSYDSSSLENRLGLNFPYSRSVISQMPISQEGKRHTELRHKMRSDIFSNTQEAIQTFKYSLEDYFARITQVSGKIDLADPIITSILKSNLILAGINLKESINYSDITLILDDSQSIKKRILREEFIKNISKEVDLDDSTYRLALLTIGVNALISTALHSIIKILTNYDYTHLKTQKYFSSTGIKHLERVAIKANSLGGHEIKPGDQIRLFVGNYEKSSIPDAQMNKKFFAVETSHSCIGMNYSLHIWNELIKIFDDNFKNIELVNFHYRKSDGIFNFPTSLIIKYTK